MEFIEYAHRGYHNHGKMLHENPFTVAVFTTENDPDGVVVKLLKMLILAPLTTPEIATIRNNVSARSHIFEDIFHEPPIAL
jgi:hypothetical protein